MQWSQAVPQRGRARAQDQIKYMGGQWTFGQGKKSRILPATIHFHKVLQNGCLTVIVLRNPYFYIFLGRRRAAAGGLEAGCLALRERAELEQAAL
jgi:hypothetical protein